MGDNLCYNKYMLGLWLDYCDYYTFWIIMDKCNSLLSYDPYKLLDMDKCNSLCTAA